LATKDILIRTRPTGNPSIQFSGSAYSSIALEVLESGSVSFMGSSGSLFSISDSLVGSLMSVNDISGLPILEVFDTDKVVMGTYGQNTLVVTGSKVGIGLSDPEASLEIKSPGVGSGTIIEIRENSGVDNILLLDEPTTGDARLRLRGNGTTTIELMGDGASYFTGGSVGIGTNNPLVNLQIESTGAGSINIVGGTAQYQGVYFGETGAIDGSIRYEPNVNYLSL